VTVKYYRGWISHPEISVTILKLWSTLLYFNLPPESYLWIASNQLLCGLSGFLRFVGKFNLQRPANTTFVISQGCWLVQTEPSSLAQWAPNTAQGNERKQLCFLWFYLVVKYQLKESSTAWIGIRTVYKRVRPYATNNSQQKPKTYTEINNHIRVSPFSKKKLKTNLQSPKSKEQ